MWSELRNRRLGGHKFVRECPVGPFFADFVCREARVIVEIDGGTHSSEDEIAHDMEREAYLRAEGFRIFRARNDEIYECVDGVCERLLAFLRCELDDAR